MRLGGAFKEQELCFKASQDQGPVCIKFKISVSFHMFCSESKGLEF